MPYCSHHKNMTHHFFALQLFVLLVAFLVLIILAITIIVDVVTNATITTVTDVITTIRVSFALTLQVFLLFFKLSRQKFLTNLKDLEFV